MKEQIRACQEALKSNPQDREAFEQLADILCENRRWRAMYELYECYPHFANWKKLVLKLNESIAHEENAAKSSAIMHYMGQIFEVKLSDPDRALKCYQHAVKTWPLRAESFDAARRIYHSVGNVHMVHKLLGVELKIDNLSDARKAALWMEMGSLAKELGDPEKAKQCVAAAYQIDAVAVEEYLVAHSAEPAPAEEAPVEEAKSEEAPVEEAKSEEMPVEEAKSEEAPVEEAKSEETPVEEAKSEEMPVEEAKSEEAPVEEAKSEEAPVEEAKSEETPVEEAKSEETPVEEAKSEETPVEEAKSEETPVEEVKSEAVPVEEAKSEETPVEEAKSEETPVEEAESEAAPVEEVKSEAVPVEEVKSEAVPVEEAKSEEAPVEEAKSEAAKDGMFKASDVVSVQACCETIYRMVDAGDDEEIEEVANRAVGLITSMEDAEPLLEALEETGCYMTLAVVLADLGEKFPKEPEKRLLKADRADVLDLHLDRRDEALGIATPIAGGDDRAAYKARAVLAGDNREELLALANTMGDLLKKIRRTPEEVPFMSDLADIYVNRLGSYKDAEEQYKRIKLADPKNSKMLRFYCKFYESSGDWQRMLSSLQTLKSAVSGSYRELGITREIARISEDKLNNPGKAVNVWNQFLKEGNFVDEARKELIGLYVRTQKWQALLEIYKNDMEALAPEQTAERIEILKKSIEIYDEKLHLDAMVIKLYHQILAIDPSNDEAVNALVERYEASKRWNDLLKILTQKAESSKDKSACVEIYYRIADLWNNSLGNVAKSVDPLLKVVELDPTQKRALRQLHEFYEQRNNWACLYDIIAKEANNAQDGEKVALLKRQAEIGECNLRSPEKAIASWQALSVCLEDPSEALEELVRLYKKQGNNEALLEVYERMLRHAHSVSERIEDMNLIAGLYLSKLNARDKGIEILTQLLDIDEGREDALGQLTQLRVDAHEWRALVDLYVSLDRANQVYELLDLAVADLDDDETQIELYNLMADVAHETLHNDDLAIAAYEKILDVDATHEVTAKRLLKFYREKGDHRKAIDAIQVIIAWTTDIDEKIAMHIEIAELFERELNDLNSAVNWYAKAVKLAPNRADIREQFERLVDETQQSALLYEVYGALKDSDILNADAKMDIHRKYARVCQNDSGKIAQAIAAWDFCYQHDSNDLEALEALCVLYEQAGEWEKYLSILDKKLSIAKLDDEICKLSFKRAQLLVAQIQNLDEAEKSYQKVLEIDADNIDALNGLKGIYDATECWEKLAGILRREMDLDIEDHLGVSFELAEILRVHLNQMSEALKIYASILDEDPTHEQTILTLENILTDGIESVEIAKILKPVYERSGATEKQCKAIEIELRVLNDEDKLSALWQLYELRANVLNDKVAAFDVAVRLFMVSPSDERVWNHLESLADESGNMGKWEQISVLYADVPVDEDHTDEWRYDLLKRRAVIIEEKLGKEQEAIELWEELHQHEPERIEPIHHLENLYKNASLFDKLVKLYEFEATLSEFSDVERIRINLEAAQIFEDILSRPEDAIQMYQHVLDIDRTCQEALEALERLYRACEQWKALAELYENDLSICSADKAVGIRCKLALLYQNELSDYEQAIECYRYVLEDDKSDEHLMQADGLLHKLVKNTDERAVDYRTALCDLLEPIYAERSQLESLIAILRIRLADCHDDYECIDLNRRIAYLLKDRLHDMDGAFEAFKDALSKDLGDENLRSDFEEIAQSLQKPEEIIKLYESQLDNIEDTQLKRTLYKRIANIYENQLSDAEHAIQAYQAMIALDDMDRESLDALEALYSNSQNWEALLDILKKKAEIGTGDEKVELLRKMAAINGDCLDNPRAAIENYREILDNVSDDADAISALEGFYTKVEDWQNLVDIYNVKLSLATDDNSRRDIIVKMAHLQEEKLKAPEEAIILYVQVLDIFPEDEESLDALDRLYLSQESYDELADILQRKISIASDSETTNALEYRLGQVYQTKLENIEQAIELYRSILARVPKHEGANAALCSLLENEDYRLNASKVLEDVYCATEQYDKLANVLEIQLSEESDPYAQVELLKRIELIHQDKLSDFEVAFGDLARILKIDQSAQFIDQIENLSAVLNNTSKLVEVYVDVINNIYEPDLQVSFNNKIGDILLKDLEDESRAEQFYKAALEIQQDDAHALDALDKIYTKREAWNDLLAILATRLDVASGAEEQIAILYRIAEIQETYCQLHEEAIASYQRIIEIDSTQERARENLAAIFERQEMWQDLTDLIRSEVSHTSDEQQISELKFKLAKIFCEKMNDDFEAIQTLREILNAQPENEIARGYLENLFEQKKCIGEISEILEPIYQTHNEWHKLIHSLEIRAEAEDDTFTKIQILSDIAKTWIENLDNPSKALETYGKIFLLQPSDSDVQMQIENLASTTLELQVWEQLYTKALDENLVEDEMDRRNIMISLARLQAERMQKHEDARKLCASILEQDPENIQAYDILEWSYAQTQDYKSLLKLWRQKVEIIQDQDEKLGLLMRIATIEEEIEHDLPAACKTYQQMHEIDNLALHVASALERLLRSTSQFEALAEFYRQQSDYASDDAIRVDYLHKLGVTLASDLHDETEATEVLGNALSIKPNSAPCKRALESMLTACEPTPENAELRHKMASLLEPLYSDEEWTKLTKVLNVLIKTEDDELSKVSLYMRLAALYDAHDSHLKRAFDNYANALMISPDNQEAKDKLEEYAEKIDDFAALADVYEKTVQATDDDVAKMAFLERIAGIALDKLHDDEKAIECFEKILQLDEFQMTAIMELEKLYAKTQKYEKNVEILKRHLNLASNVFDQKDLLYRIADILEKNLTQTDKAIQVYHDILDVDPEDQVALDALEKLYLQTENYAALVNIYKRKIDVVHEVSERVALELNVAKISQEKLGDTEGAIEFYAQTLNDDNENIEALHALEKLYADNERYDDLIDVIQKQADIAQKSGNTTLKIENEIKMARIFIDNLQDKTRAVEVLCQILETNPQTQEAVDILQQLLDDDLLVSDIAAILMPVYKENHADADYVKLCERRIEVADDEYERRDIYLDAARVADEELNDVDKALEFISKAMLANPTDDEIIEQAEKIANRHEAYAKLTALCEKIVDVANDPDTTVKLSLLAAKYYEQQLVDIPKTIEQYRRIIDVDDMNAVALKALHSLYQQTRQTEELLDILHKMIDAAIAPINDYRFELAQMIMDQQPKEALELLKQIVWDDAERSDAFEAIENLLPHKELVMDIAEILEPRYNANHDDEKFARLLNAKIEVTQDPLDALLLIKQLATLQATTLNDERAAFDSYLKALSYAPDDSEVLAALENLGSKLELWQELASAYKTAINAVADESEKIALYAKIADTYADKLHEIDEAKQALNQILAIDAENMEALKKLDAIYTQANDYPQLLEIKARLAEITYDAPQQKQLLFQCADIALNTLNENERGAAFLEKILEIDDADANAIEPLLILYQESGNDEKYLDLLNKKLLISNDPDVRFDIYVQIAKTAQTRLNDPAVAIDAYRNALELRRRDDIYAALENIFTQYQQYQDLDDLLISQLDDNPDAQKRANIRVKRAKIAQDQFKDSDAAIELLKDALNDDPTNADAFNALDEIYSQTGDYQALFELLKEQKDAASDEKLILMYNIRIAKLAAIHLGDVDTAIQSLTDVLKTEPQNIDAINSLIDIYEQQKSYDLALGILKRKLECLTTNPQKAEVYCHVARMIKKANWEISQIENSYQAALSLDPKNTEALDALMAIAKEQNNLPRLFELLAHKANLQHDPEAKNAILLDIAQQASQDERFTSIMVQALEKLHNAKPDDIELAEKLVNAYIKAGNLQAAQPILDTIIGQLVDAKQNKLLPPFYSLKGRILKQTGDLVGARKAFEAASAIDKNNIPNNLELGIMLYEAQEYDAALKIMQTLLLHQMNVKDKAVKTNIFYYLGMLRVKTNDPKRAKDMFNRALGVDPNHQPSKTALAELG